ncbi:MAG: PAS domain-containing sensor histidine kinase [Muricauda sp.]|nr:PAS domain-containing sensor histidine kinase [Allomuricauda sp.]MAU27377.1 PAS domain-containing sensor histidine kinase [Allomuricauda sp.]MBC29717.1 PAS domain-containing sensor histidine kinase [Allomuricauda sp.]|tara:strand:- start:159 stop:1397 length:1239 start_codon:yes stop_codon:yes gene_type:complete
MKVFEKNSNIFRLLTEAISEGILVVNSEQLIVASNGSASQMFGYEEGELVGKSLNILIPSKYHKAHKGHVQKFFARSEKRRMGAGLDLYGVRKDGAQFPVEVGLNPFELYGNTYIMALILDVTKRKEQESEIKLLNAELEDKIKQRTQELEAKVIELREEVKRRKEAEEKATEALQKEKELGDLKTKFLSLVSHEFKTPLSAILTSTTLLSKYTQTEQQEKRNKHLATIKAKVKYLNNILNDFLSVERLESGKVKYNITSFPLSKVINEVVYDSNMLLKTGQKILYPNDIDDIILEFDEKILELVLSNLIHNAIKYSPEDATIDLRASKGDGHITIKVIDEGMGIPKDDQKYIFQRYYRAGNALLTQGTGIGLNIAKLHIGNLGGDISFTSTEGEGSEFELKLPYKNSKLGS